MKTHPQGSNSWLSKAIVDFPPASPHTAGLYLWDEWKYLFYFLLDSARSNLREKNIYFRSQFRGYSLPWREKHSGHHGKRSRRNRELCFFFFAVHKHSDAEWIESGAMLRSLRPTPSHPLPQVRLSRKGFNILPTVPPSGKQCSKTRFNRGHFTLNQ